MSDCVTVHREHVLSLDRLLSTKGQITLAQLSEFHIPHQQAPCGLAEQRKQDHVVFVIQATPGEEPTLKMTYKPSGDLEEVHGKLLRRLWSRLQSVQEEETIGIENGGYVGLGDHQFTLA